MKKLLLLLLLIPLAFAASWQEIAAIALVTSAILLGIIYGVGSGFNINELQALAKEEAFQLIATVVLVVVLVGSDSIINAISVNPQLAGEQVTGTSTMQEAANATLNSILTDLSGEMAVLSYYDHRVAIEGSKSGQCNVLQVGYGVSGCGGFSLVNPPLSLAGSILGFSIGEVSAMKRLLAISVEFSMQLLLPFGILLRTLKFTRGAGGFIIAVAISLHLLLPAGVLFNNMLVSEFRSNEASAEYRIPITKPVAAGGIRLPGMITALPVNIDLGTKTEVVPTMTIPECTPLDAIPSLIPGIPIPGPASIWEGAKTVLEDVNTDPMTVVAGVMSMETNEDRAAATYFGLRLLIRGFLFGALLNGTLGPVIALLMVMAGIRAFSAAAGAEVDVSAIARFV